MFHSTSSRVSPWETQPGSAGTIAFRHSHPQLFQGEVQYNLALDDYKVVLYRNQPFGWVAEVPSITGCYALMPTRPEALSELEQVFALIEAEYRDVGVPLPVDTTEIVHA